MACIGLSRDTAGVRKQTQAINPTQPDGQFFDRGPQYRTAVFYLNDEQKQLAAQSKKELEESEKFSEPIATEISPATKFWEAESYHQKYYQKNPEAYERYKEGSGRGPFLREVWGKTE